MTDISSKSNSLRIAVAEAVVRFSQPGTYESLRSDSVPKGNVFESARIAALFGVKKTSDLIPDCHPLPIEYCSVRFELSEISLTIEVEVHTVYKTGVEVEAMHGASIAALTAYDMLKPIDPHIVIEGIRLLRKQGGKSDRALTSLIEHQPSSAQAQVDREKTQNVEWLTKREPESIPQLRAAVLVCSDRVAAGEAQDRSGEFLVQQLRLHGFSCSEATVLPDELDRIQEQLRVWCEQGIECIISTGGTGVSGRDRSVEAMRPLFDRELPGVSETMRRYGQDRSPTAMLSRSCAGMHESSLLIAMPGSLKAVQECCAAIFPQVFHVFSLKH